MRRFATVLFCAALAGCASPADQEAEAPAVPTGPVGGDAEALLPRLGAGALAPAFARLAATPYTARVVVTELNADGQTVGRFERRLAHTPGAPDRASGTRASGTLADTVGLTADRLSIHDPFPLVLPDVPPYLAPATREQYAVRVARLGGAVRRVDVAHTADTEQAVQRVVADVDTATGAVLRLSVARASQSAIYDEATRADVRLRPARGGALPVAGETTSTVASPLSGARTFRVAWTVAPGSGYSETNTR